MMRKTVLEVTQRAAQTQALKKITAGHELLPPAENGVRYVLFQTQTANQKPVAAAPAETPAPEKKPFRDPFAKEHLEQDLFVAQLHDTHNVVLNKFNVVDEHVVLPTIEFEAQETPLSKADFRAMWTAMGALDAFAFFNCGYESGASQPHKHMQLISYSSMKSYTNLDMPPLLQFIHDRLQTQASDGIVHLRDLPFFHFLHRIDLPADIDDQVAADQLHAIYATVLQQLNATAYPGSQEAAATSTATATADRFVAYNLLLTKSFLFVVPRKTQRFNGIEVNAIGFIGSFFVRNDEQRAFFETQGPMELLRQVTFPPM
uniref:Uncharacterized protein n=1 Tax=Globisporangium ultimum (strain ATCC 200006 / CBS 805.95 / DAOM BR144) TaxID=431595 RepID=K3WRM4_GLOUD